jgi:hypothetical protein
MHLEPSSRLPVDPFVLEWLREVYKDEYYDIPEYEEDTVPSAEQSNDEIR